MSDPIREIFTRKAYPELAAALRARSQRIIDLWVRRVSQLLPKADELTFTQLRNNMPELLERLARVMETERVEPVARLEEISPNHADLRFEQQFRLDEMLIEYQVLRRTVLEQIIGQLGRHLSMDESSAINLGIDITMSQAVMEFAHRKAEELRAGAEAQAKYLSFLSHDIRGALNGVLLMAEVLRQELGAALQFADSLEDIDLMRRSILDTVNTMDRFLHAEKLRKGAFEIRPQKIDLSEIAAELMQQFGYQARDKGLELRHEVPPNCTVETDRELLSLVLQNLIANAVKFSSAGSVRIYADGCAMHDGSIELSVVDQGPGIPPDELEKLFQPFSRGPTHGQAGSGLGLAIARQAAELINSRLWGESEPGKGSTFRLRLPPRIEPRTRSDV